jgi:hypothetical protein
MALDKTALKNGIKQLHVDMLTRDVDSNDEYASRMADLIEAFVKSGKVATGITVQVGSNTGATTTLGNIV